MLATVTTVGIAAPVAGASAASTSLAAPTFAFPVPQIPSAGLPLPSAGLPAFPSAGLPAFTPPGLPAFTPAPLTFVGPSVGQVAAVIGPTVITTAPSTFTNTNIQVSAGSNGSGGQAGA
jgi:hypothetical protein